jgi:hypothetical protein
VNLSGWTCGGAVGGGGGGGGRARPPPPRTPQPLRHCCCVWYRVCTGTGTEFGGDHTVFKCMYYFYLWGCYRAHASFILGRKKYLLLARYTFLRGSRMFGFVTVFSVRRKLLCTVAAVKCGLFFARHCAQIFAQGQVSHSAW